MSAWGGTCSRWRNGSGCVYPFAARPYVCRALVPTPPECKAPPRADKHAIVVAWKPFDRVFRSLREETEPESPLDMFAQMLGLAGLVGSR